MVAALLVVGLLVAGERELQMTRDILVFVHKREGLLCCRIPICDPSLFKGRCEDKNPLSLGLACMWRGGMRIVAKNVMECGGNKQAG